MGWTRTTLSLVIAFAVQGWTRTAGGLDACSIRARLDIPEGEEITVPYSSGYWKRHDAMFGREEEEKQVIKAALKEQGAYNKKRKSNRARRYSPLSV